MIILMNRKIEKIKYNFILYPLFIIINDLIIPLLKILRVIFKEYLLI